MGRFDDIDDEPVHRCHARDCMATVKPELLMCGKHWGMVQKHVQRMVLKSYRAGQCDDKKPSLEWLHWAACAIGWVALKEGKKLTDAESLALELMGTT